MGELHLDILVDRLVVEFKVEANIGAPQGWAYRETISREAEINLTHKNSPAFPVSLLSEDDPDATEPGEGTPFESRIVGGGLFQRIHPPASAKRITRSWDSGPLAAFRSSTSKFCRLIDGKFHDV